MTHIHSNGMPESIFSEDPIEKLAKHLKMGRTKLYRMVQKGDIPSSKFGNQ